MAKNPHNLPALTYDPFIDFFEKKMADIQAEVENIRGLEPLYNALKLGLEKQKTKHEHSIAAHGSTLCLYLQLGQDGHWKHYLDNLAVTISSELARLKLRENTPPAIEHDTWDTTFIWKVIRGDSVFALRALLSVPFDGNKYCHISKRKETQTITRYSCQWYDEPQEVYTAPDLTPDKVPF